MRLAPHAVVGLTTLTALTFLLAACGTHTEAPATPGNEQGFISAKGKGAVTILPPDKRGEPIALAGETLDGTNLDVASYRGKIVLINVWGSWCAPCRQEAPYLQAAWDQLRPDGSVQFVGLNTKDDAAGAAAAFDRRFGITYPSLVDPDGSLLLTFRSTIPPAAIPSTLVLDRQGRVAARVLGPTSRGTFVGLVDQIRSET